MHYGLEYQFLRKLAPATVIRKVCDAYRVWRKKSLLSPKESQQLELLLGIAQITFPAYCEYWKKDDAKVEWIGREEKFDVPYTFQTPEGPRTVRLRGMRDGLFRVSGLLGLLETKNKSKISEGEIRDGLQADMQTLFYSFVTWIETGEMPKVVKYNIIRRATNQSPYRNVDMDDKGWLKKLQTDIATRPDFYFSRFRVDVTERNMKDFKEKTLDPLLCRFVHWSDSLKKTPVGKERFNSPYHSLNLTNLIGKYGKVDLWEALVNGNYRPYRVRSEVFPELADSFQVT